MFESKLFSFLYVDVHHDIPIYKLNCQKHLSIIAPGNHLQVIHLDNALKSINYDVSKIVQGLECSLHQTQNPFSINY